MVLKMSKKKTSKFRANLKLQVS